MVGHHETICRGCVDRDVIRICGGSCVDTRSCSGDRNDPDANAIHRPNGGHIDNEVGWSTGVRIVQIPNVGTSPRTADNRRGQRFAVVADRVRINGRFFAADCNNQLVGHSAGVEGESCRIGLQAENVICISKNQRISIDHLNGLRDTGDGGCVVNGVDGDGQRGVNGGADAIGDGVCDGWNGAVVVSSWNEGV